MTWMLGVSSTVRMFLPTVPLKSAYVDRCQPELILSNHASYVLPLMCMYLEIKCAKMRTYLLCVIVFLGPANDDNKPTA